MEVKGDLNIDGTLTVNNAAVTGGGLANVVEDTTPQLGGNLDVNGKSIVSNTVTGGNTPDNVNITGGSADTRSGASVNITSGDSNSNSGGDISLVTGSSISGDAGSIVLSGGTSSTGNGGSVLITNGGGGLAAGVVQVAANGGALSLAGSSVSITSSGGSINVNTSAITNVVDPTNPQDAATKNYVDTHAGGGGGFYGIVWSDGTVTKRTDRLSFNGVDFYLDGYRPTVNLKNTILRADGSIVADLLHIGSSDVMVVNGSVLTAGLALNSDDQVVLEKDTASNTAANGSIDYFGRSRGTHAARLAVQDGDTLGTLASVGHDGTDFNVGSRIDFVVEGTVSNNVIPTKVRVRQTNQAGTLVDTLSIHSDGYTTIASDLNVGNKVTAEAFYLTTGGEVTPLTVRDIDTSPTVTNVNTLEFTNGTVSDQGGGVARVTISSGLSAIDDGLSTYSSPTALGFSNIDFYLSRSSSTKPVVNLRQSLEPIAVYIDAGMITKVALEPFSDHTQVIEDIQVVCRSGSATAGFYIVPSASPTFRDGIRVGNADPITFSTTTQRIIPTTARTLTPGDALFLNIYGNANAKGIRLKVRLRRT